MSKLIAAAGSPFQAARSEHEFRFLEHRIVSTGPWRALVLQTNCSQKTSGCLEAAALRLTRTARFAHGKPFCWGRRATCKTALFSRRLQNTSPGFGPRFEQPNCCVERCRTQVHVPLRRREFRATITVTLPSLCLTESASATANQARAGRAHAVDARKHRLTIRRMDQPAG